MQRALFLGIGLLLGCGAGVHAAQTQARLILNAETARPGETVMAGVHLHTAPGWHTYWRNPGDSGKATEIRWNLPPGVTAGPALWPVPSKRIDADQTSYVYEGDAILLLPLTLSRDLPPGDLNLKANVSWLECETLCVPGRAEVQSKLTVGPSSKPSPAADTIEGALKKLPRRDARVTARAWWEKGPDGDSRPLIIEWTSQVLGAPQAPGEADFYPYENPKLEVKGDTQSLAAPAGTIRLRKMVKKLEGGWPTEFPGLAIERPKGAEPAGYEVRPAIGEHPPASSRSGGMGPIQSQSLWVMLGLAFIGGLILNIMPCVLPVISLKILSFVKQSREARGQVRQQGAIYVLGVLVSFLALAGMVIGAKLAGGDASWGMQFQNASFLVAMTILVTLVSLNLFGVFEVTLGGRVMGAAGELAGQGGTAGAFFNGMLATVLATPCTAPFLAVALGFAFAQPPLIILVMFLAVALGLAAPYILLSIQPGWLRILPKPGAWMERFRILMGFPMLGTAFWLFTLSSTHLGKSGTFWFGIFLVVLALAAWMWGEFVQRTGRRKGLVMAASAVLVVGMGAYALNQRPGIQWQPWSPEAVAQARGEGRPVLVDFTADWCLTCQVNKKTSIEVASVEEKLKEIHAVALMGDYTRENPAITAELNRFNRAGVPLVLVYPKDPKADPIVLPQVLTRRIVIAALERAAAGRSDPLERAAGEKKQ